MKNFHDIDELVNAIIDLNKRVAALENKRPEYVPPPVFGPVKCSNNYDAFLVDNIEDNT